MPRFALDQRGMTNRVAGLTGAAGPAGAPGGGTIPGIVAVDSLSGTPRSVTDWGPILNTAIAGGTRYFVFGPYDYPYTTKIDFGHHNNVIFVGAGGITWTTASNDGYTKLIWKGTGAGNAIDASVTNATTFQDIVFTYTSASYTGTLIKASGNGATQLSVRSCHFSYAAQGQTITAAYAFDLGNGILPMFDNCTFEGFLTYILGFDGATNVFCNSAKFNNCVFQGQCQHSIANPGQAWTFDTCIFESVGAVDQTVQSHISILVSNLSGTGTTILLTQCAHWDASSNSTKWIAQASGIEAHISMQNCVENNASLTKSLDLQGIGTISLQGGIILSPVDLGDAASTTHAKTGIALGGGLQLGSATPLLNLDSGVNATGYGHRNIDISATYRSSEGVSDNPSYRTGIDREEARTVVASYQPTITLNAGAPANIALWAQSGNDARGNVQAQNTAGTTSGTGLLFDVTFAKPPALNPNFPPQPVVVLSPMNATAAACGGYALVAPGTPGKFTIGINVGIPGSGGGTNVASWAYAVTWV